MKSKSIASTAAAIVLASGASHASTIASANFSGMSVTNATTVNAVAGSNDFTWSLINAASTNYDVVTDDGSPGIGSGNALRIDQSGTGTFRGMIGTLGSTPTINLGDTLTLSFSGRYYEAPGNSSGGFRFGIINSGDLDNNFFAQLGTGGNAGFGLLRDLGGDDSPGAGTTSAIASTASGATYATLGTSAFSAEFSITRTGVSEYALSVNVNGAIRTATTTTGWNDYNAIFIRNGGISNDFLVDNVTVTLVPEPTAILLGGLGLLGLLRRRR